MCGALKSQCRRRRSRTLNLHLGVTARIERSVTPHARACAVCMLLTYGCAGRERLWQETQHRASQHRASPTARAPPCTAAMREYHQWELESWVSWRPAAPAAAAAAEQAAGGARAEHATEATEAMEAARHATADNATDRQRLTDVKGAAAHAQEEAGVRQGEAGADAHVTTQNHDAVTHAKCYSTNAQCAQEDAAEEAGEAGDSRTDEQDAAANAGHCQAPPAQQVRQVRPPQKQVALQVHRLPLSVPQDPRAQGTSYSAVNAASLAAGAAGQARQVESAVHSGHGISGADASRAPRGHFLGARQASDLDGFRHGFVSSPLLRDLLAPDILSRSRDNMQPPQQLQPHDQWLSAHSCADLASSASSPPPMSCLGACYRWRRKSVLAVVVWDRLARGHVVARWQRWHPVLYDDIVC